MGRVRGEAIGWPTSSAERPSTGSLLSRGVRQDCFEQPVYAFSDDGTDATSDGVGVRDRPDPHSLFGWRLRGHGWDGCGHGRTVR